MNHPSMDGAATPRHAEELFRNELHAGMEEGRKERGEGGGLYLKM